MSPLRQRMTDAMTVRGLSARTIECYTDSIARLSRHYGGVNPARLSPEQIEAYLLHLVKDRHLSYSSVNHAASASRFLFETVLGRPTEVRHLRPPMAKVPQKQPELLSRQEISRLFDACPHPGHRMLLQTLYASGLRISEACQLQVADIDSNPDRMTLRVRAGKGGADRYTLLSPSLLDALRAHCVSFRPHRQAPGWLFAHPRTGEPLAIGYMQRIYQRARHKAGIMKMGSTHTLRHCFATHLLEGGVDLYTISRLLGHGHISTTTRYLHLISPQFKPTPGVDPLDLLAALTPF
jgi:site-specific recombinase XerD